jgi:predicted enzyme related to lactoylglutathione lyase
MGRVVHFEIQATEPQALIDFYSSLFGWSFSRWGQADYWLVTTGPDDKPGINGGLLPRRGPVAADGQGVNAYVCTAEVDSLDESLAKAGTLGAMIAVPKMPIPGVGWLAYVKDPDGNLVGMMQNDPAAS